jgi:hypothetical protein
MTGLPDQSMEQLHISLLHFWEEKMDTGHDKT